MLFVQRLDRGAVITVLNQVTEHADQSQKEKEAPAVAIISSERFWNWKTGTHKPRCRQYECLYKCIRVFSTNSGERKKKTGLRQNGYV